MEFISDFKIKIGDQVLQNWTLLRELEAQECVFVRSFSPGSKTDIEYSQGNVDLRKRSQEIFENAITNGLDPSSFDSNHSQNTLSAKFSLAPKQIIRVTVQFDHLIYQDLGSADKNSDPRTGGTVKL